jgi:hypothetical protein
MRKPRKKRPSEAKEEIMSYRYFVFAVAFGAFVAFGPARAAGQAISPAVKAVTAGKAWTPPRTSDGHPDLQGVWTNNTVTPLQRPKELAGKELYTEEELAAVIKKERQRLDLNLDEGRPTEPGTADDVHYDFSQFGLDRGQAKMAWNRRTSIIVGPEARKRIAERRAQAKGHEFDGPENRPIGARCIARTNVGPPLLPTAYNSNLQIVQGAGYVAIETEMIHDTRIIPTDGRPHISSNIRQWYGDSVGHWEGDTLVIDTTNFTDLSPFEDAQNVHVIERLTAVDPDTILYQFTVEDPAMWTKPWSGELPITRIQGQIYEYACHEANYGLVNTLRGARVAEEQAAKKAAK